MNEAHPHDAPARPAAARALPPAPDDPDRLLLHADLDGELDPAASLALARRCAERPELAAEAARLAALRRALHALPAADGPSPALRARLAGLLPDAAAPSPGPGPGPGPLPRRSRAAVWRSDWRALAASGLLGAGLAAASATLYYAPDPALARAGAVAAGHRRALLAQHTVDVASSDRHTVKPWLGSRLALAPTVIDLAADGYPLLGARIEIVDGRPAPTLVYGHREHMISLSLVPADDAADAPPALRTVAGYGVLAWQAGGFAHLAVSDIDRAGLEDFVSRYRAAERRGGDGEAPAAPRRPPLPGG